MKKLFLLVILLAAPSFAALPDSGDDDSARAQSQKLTRLERELREARKLAMTERLAQQERLRELTAESRARQRNIAAIEKELDRRTKKRDDKRQELDKHEQAIATFKEWSSSVKKRLLAYADELVGAVDSGIPWQKAERVQSIQDVMTTAKLEDTMPAAALSSVARLQKEEFALGQSVERKAPKIDVNGDEVAVQAFHIGLLCVIFANDNGEILGCAHRGESLIDGLKNVDSAVRDGYTKAIEILNRRRTPGLIDLYLPPFQTADKEGR